jgi:TRAP-type C4-dicarboxylate transport system permease small subunit
MKLIEQSEKVVGWASKKLDVVAGIALVAMMALIFGNVLCPQSGSPSWVPTR